jgi:hypothetical protein
MESIYDLGHSFLTKLLCFVIHSVGDPELDPDPQDPHDCGLPGSGSISQRYVRIWIRLRILPFSHKCSEGLK